MPIDRQAKTEVLQRSDCVILPLVLKRQWYAMIAAGDKREEYRALTPYWDRRIENWVKRGMSHRGRRARRLVVGFACGYKNPDRFFLCREIGARNVSWHSEWGEPAGSHFVLSLGNPITFTKDQP